MAATTMRCLSNWTRTASRPITLSSRSPLTTSLLAERHKTRLHNNPKRENRPSIHRRGYASTSSQPTSVSKTPSTNATNVSRPCWRCGVASKPIDSLCPDCKAVLPLVPGLTYFDVLLGPGQVTFDLDVKKLRLKFLRIQQLVHPDSHSQKTPQEHGFAEDQSSFVNKGYRTLKDPLERALYMLKIQGKPVEDGSSLAEEDFELLTEVMEYRERIEDADGQDEVRNVKAEAEVKSTVCIVALSEAFRQRKWDEARIQVVRLRYYQNIRKAAEDKEFSMQSS